MCLFVFVSESVIVLACLSNDVYNQDNYLLYFNEVGCYCVWGNAIVFTNRHGLIEHKPVLPVRTHYTAQTPHLHAKWIFFFSTNP